MPPAPFPRRALIEELEPRLLFSADFAPGVADVLSPQTEQRLIDSDGEFANATDSQQAQHARLEVVFIDLRVQDYDKILADIHEQNTDGHSIEIVLLDSERDGVAQIGEFLSQRQDIDAIHLISHGTAGSVQLGSGELNFDSLLSNAATIKQWGNALSAEADILIYGCDLASTESGQSLINALGKLTGADVAASDDKTGAAEQGGDWVLEYKTGTIQTGLVLSTAMQQNWENVLAITANGTASSTQTTNATSLTWSHTVASGTDRLLVVELAIDGLGAGVSSVTYGGVAMTQIGRGTGNHAVEIWGLVNPTVGTANIVVSFGGTTAAAGGATSFNGVNQSTPFGTFVSATGTGTAASVTVASATGDLVIDAQYWKLNTANVNGAGQTTQWSQANASMLGGSTTEAGAASVTMSGSSASSSQWEIGAVSIKAATTPAGITVSPISGLVTTESGGTAQFSVVLDRAPTANVTIGLSSSDITEGTLSASSLTFTTANWSTPQTVTITGVDDTLDDGNIAYSIITAAATSADASYNGLNAPNVSVTNTDNDTFNTIVVDTTNDTLDGNTTSIAALISNKGADGKISLREAITAANNTANGAGGADRIAFSIAGTGVHTITLGSLLPTISQAVVIDATTDDSYAANGNRPAIVINGNNTVQDGFQLYTNSSGTTIRGFVIQNFTQDGIDISGSNGNTIAGNWIGLNSAGTGAAGNQQGINLWNSNNNIIGGSAAADRNVISANSGPGISINTNNGTSTGNQIRGNYIGTNAAGTAAVGNGNQGVFINAANNVVGGTVTGYGNVISGTVNWAGIGLDTQASGTLVAGNLIGLNAAGTAALANNGGGITVLSANNTIGGVTAETRNVISGNNSRGIYIYGAAATGNVVIGNYIGTNAAGTGDVNGTLQVNGNSGVVIDGGASNNRIGTNADGSNDVAERNLISGNNWYGVEMIGAGTTGNVVQGNFIGTDVTGLTALGNSNGGVSFWGGSGNTLGSGLSGAGNVISGNDTGVLVANAATNNKVQGNIIGLGADGSTVVGNTGDGVYFYNGGNASLVTGNIIGTDADGSNDAGERNVISGNYSGVAMENTEVTGNTVAGNYIGTDATGTLDRGNTHSGVYADSNGNTFGGDTPAERNLISGNNGYGFYVAGSNNVITGNWIGLDSTGNVGMGNTWNGVYLGGGTNNRVGGTAAGEGNVISGHGDIAVRLEGGSGHIIQGNLIGTNHDGSALIGNLVGFSARFGATNVLFGGTAAGAGNVVAGNGHGVLIDDNTTSNIAVLGNRIYSNTNLGIDLGSNGVTANDALDTDTGANNLQNFPVLYNAVVNGTTITITGAINSTANTTFRIEFFNNPLGTEDASGYGEGRVYLGAATVTTDGSGNATINAVLTGVSVSANDRISSTATVDLGLGAYGSTSEFSQNVIASAPNQAPSGANGSINATEDTVYTFTLTDFGFSDADGDDLMRVHFDTLPGSGTLRWNGTAFAAGNFVSATDIFAGLLTYTPAVNTSGTSAASFTFRVQDDGGTANGGVDTDPTANTITINISAVNDAPVITSNGGGVTASVSVAENTTAVTTVTSSDIDGGTAVYAISGGADASKFTINSATGALSFVSAPNYEAPTDVGGNNVYDVTVQVSDGNGGTDTQAIAVTVGNQVISTVSASGSATSAAGGVYTLNLSADEDATSWTINWGDGTIETIAGDPTSATHTYAAANAGLTFNILVSATDTAGTHFGNGLIAPTAFLTGEGLYRYTGQTGSFSQFFSGGELTNPYAVIVGPDGLIYAAGHTSDNIVRYNAATGAYVDTFVAAGSGGLNAATGLAFGPDGHLYVSNQIGDSILKFNGTTGAFMSAFVSAGSGGLNAPVALTFRPDGYLYVSSYNTNSILRYNATTGAFVGTFVAAGSGGLVGPAGMAWGADGNLYVASNDATVKRYNGTTGAFINNFVTTGSGGLGEAVGLAFGPDGNLYVSSYSTDKIIRYNGTTGALIGDYVTTGSGGLDGPTGFTFLPSHQVRVVSTNVSPVLDASKSPTLASVNEDAGAPVGAVGTLVSSLVDFASPAGQVDNVTDSNVGAQLGIAVTAADTANGTWYFSTNGGTNWSALGAVSEASARLLAADANTRLYFQPNADWNGTITNAITFRAWDQTSGANGGTADTSTNGGTTAFSAATDMASLTVSAVNDAPSLIASAPLNGIAEDDVNNSGTLVSQLIATSISDVDAGPLKGIAITSVDNTNGSWQYTLNGTTWLSVGSPSTSAALLLPSDATTAIRYVPNANYNGTSGLLYYKAWDQTTGLAGGTHDVTVSGGTTAFSSTANGTSVGVAAVNDAPVNTLASAGASVPEDSVVQLLNVLSIADVDAGVGSFTVTLSVTPAAGTLSAASGSGVMVSGSGTSTLVLTGSLASINAYFASAATAPVFTAVADYNGAVSLTAVTNDNGNTGSGSALTDSDTSGGTISAVADIADDSVTTNEDTPVSLAPLSNDSFEDAGRTITHINGTAIATGGSLAVTGGTVTLNADSTLTFTPTANYNGAPSFTYTVTSGGVTETASVSVTVNPSNDAPIAADDRLALEFDGVDDYVSIADSASLQMTSTMTMEAWVNPDVSGNAVQIILNKEGEYEMAIFADGSLNFAFAEGGVWSWHDTGVDIARHTWTHIAISYDTGVVTTYINGAFVDSQTLTASVIDDVYPAMNELRIGGRTNSPAGQYFEGQIADVRVWNVARSQAEISAAMNTQLTGSDAGLAGYWMLDDKTGTTAVDMTANVNHGTLVNGAAWAGYRVLEDGSLNVPAPGVLGNDYDADGDALSAIKVSDPAHGLLVLNADGSFTYTPDADWHGTDSFTYKINDSSQDSNVATVYITVDPVQDAPDVAPVDLGNVNEDDSQLITQAMLLAGASDADGDSLTAINLTLTAGSGTLSDNGNGTWTFAPAADWNGAVSFSFDVSDGITATANTASLAVNPINDAPIAFDESASGNEDTDISGNVLANDADVDNASLTASLVSGPAHGTLVLSADGSFTYTPDADWHGSDSFTYSANDGVLDSNVATVYITVDPVQDVPTVANPISDQSATEDAPFSFQFAANTFNDADTGDTLTYTVTGLPAWLSFDAATRTFSGTPANGDVGVYTLTVRATDGSGAFVEDQFDVTVMNANDAPVLSPIGNQSINEGATLTFTATASDADVPANTLTFSLGGAPVGATIDAATGVFNWTPTEAQGAGIYSFDVIVSDGAGGADSETITVTVHEVNSAPAGTDRMVTTLEDTPYIFTAADFGFTDPGDVPVNLLLAVKITTLPGAGSLTLNGIAVTAGQTISVADISAGWLVFEPAADANGLGYASLTFQVQDDGGTANGGVDLDPTPNMITLNVTAVNDAPTVTPINLGAIDEDGSLLITQALLLSGTNDVDLDSLTAINLTLTAGSGTFTDNGDGTWTFTPDTDWSGSANFSFDVYDGTDSTPNTASLVVNPVNDEPATSPVMLAPISEDSGPRIITQAELLSNASDVDGPALTAINLSITSGTGTLTDNGDGTWTYTPASNDDTSVTFSYVVTDGSLTTSGSAALDITPVNDAPTAGDISFATDEDNVYSGTLPAASDIDSALITYALDVDATHGNVLLNSDGSFSYTPDSNYFGADNFSYTVSDGAGGSNTYTVTITVNPVNDAPTIVAPVDLGALNEDGSLVITQAMLLAGSSDIENNPLTAINLILTAGNGTLTDNGNGTWTFIPTADWNGAVSFGFDITDGMDSTSNTADLVVNPVNDAPLAVDNAFSGNEDNDIGGNVLANDSDVDNASLTATLVAGPAHGTLVLNADGSFTYTPDANWHGGDSFTYVANDGALDSNVATVNLTVNPVNDAPTVAPIDLGAISEDGSLLITQAMLLSGANDVDGDSLTAISLTLTSGSGTLTDNGDGSWTFTPAADWNGSAGFSFAVDDGTTITANTASLTVNPVNDAPTVAPIDLGAISEDGSLLITQAMLLSGANDVDGDSLTAISLTLTAGSGTLTDNGDGSWTFTPDADWSGSAGFSFAVDDGTTTTANTASLTVDPVNDAPVITSNVLNIVEGGTVVLSNADLSVADVEQSAAQLTFTISNVTHGQFEWAAVPGAAITSFTQADIDAGLVVFVHDASDMAPSYDVSVSDGTTTTGPQAATITFTPVDEGINVTALSGMSTTEAGGAVTFDVALNSQPIADVTVFIASGNPAEGTASVSSLTFTSANWSIAQQITVTGVDDFVDDGDQNYTIQIDANSTDRNYHLLAAPGVALTSLDDDTAGILITPASGLVTDESGASDTFSVVLTSQPLANVIIDLSSSNPAEGTLSTSSLTFTPGNWNIPQVVAVTGVNDIPDDGDIAYQAVAAPASSADANYNGLAAGAVDLTNRDVAEPVVVDTPPIEPAPEPDPQTPPGEEAGAPQSPEDSSPSVTESGLAPVLQGQPIDESGFAVETAPESQSETALNAGLKSGAPLSVNNESVRHEVLTNPESQGGVLLRLLEIIQADFTLGEDGGNRISPAIQVDIVQDEQFRVDILSQGAQITAVSLSVGAVWWALRAGGLFASLLTSLPAWRSFDVLPVLSRDEDDDDASWSFGDEPEDDDNKDDTRMPELTP